MRNGVIATLAVLLIAPWAGASPARAHGRPAALGTVTAQPGSPERLVAQATWGFALSDDGGGRWRWLCSAVVGVDARSEDPALVVMGDGAILVGTYGGLLRSDDGGCSWTRPEEALADVFIVDLHRVDDERVLAVAADTGGEDELWGSEDGGRTWTRRAGFGEVLVDLVRTAPSDPMRVYASGGIPSDGTAPRRAFVLRSDDGGASFMPFELPLEEGERLLHVWAVDPIDADVLYGQVLHFNGETAPERIVRSADGGETFETVLAIPYVGGLMVTASGAVLAGSRLGGLHRAEDGVSFSAVDPMLPVTCLSEIDGAVWACVDQALAGYALARSDDGVLFEPALALGEITEMAECPRCSPAGIECPAWTPDIVYDLGLDASLPSGFDPDASTGAPRDAGVPAECRPEAPGGCGCRAGARSRVAAPVWLAALALIAARRRRGRAARNPTKAGECTPI